jgi:hypothetical protein
MANAVTAALPLTGLMKRNGLLGVVFSPGNDGIIHTIIFTLIGIGLYSYRMNHTRRP